MRKLFLAMIFAAQPALAQVDCAQVGELSENIMTMRQAGVPIQQALRTLETVSPQSEAAYMAVALAKNIILVAYQLPRHESAAGQSVAASNFGTQVFIQCIKAQN